ncbi:MAG TPA: hypothetical protein VFA52_00595 [Candidatus Paceibacterota bacterium]|nr:hypothetical protein [Candidatus Paceibacterota bacterium]
MKNKYLITLFIICVVILVIVFKLPAPKSTTSSSSTNNTPVSSDLADVGSAVTDFGSKLKNVSLLAPTSTLKADIARYYGPYITVELLAEWQNNPSLAPGRLTSSPWPDHIDILSINQIDSTHYQVQGEIVEMTSQEVVAGGDSGREEVKITLTKVKNKWLISQFGSGK